MYPQSNVFLSPDFASQTKPVKRAALLLTRRPPIWKRGLDILGAGAGLIVLAPVFAAAAVCIKVVSPGPLFFRQQRAGYGSEPFWCWKFRTMRVDADASVHQQHVRSIIESGDEEKPTAKLDLQHDPRIIPFGLFLRQSCIDELPQLFNVLRGNMSLVGPRPEPLYAAQHYLPWHTQRLDVLPGMTGLWQVSGKNSTTFKEMIRLDIFYAKHQSLWFDLKILLLTIPTILHQMLPSKAVRFFPSKPLAESS